MKKLFVFVGLICMILWSCEKPIEESIVNDSKTKPVSGVLKDGSVTDHYITDRDGNLYPLKHFQLGDYTYEWTGKDLKTYKYWDGTGLDELTDESSWETTYEPAFSYVQGDPDYTSTYGFLYNFYAVDESSSNPFIPGFLVADHNNWHVLIEHTLSNNNGSLKWTGTDYWNSPNTDATNSSGFAAKGASYKLPDGTYGTLKEEARYWGSNYTGTNGYGVRIIHDDVTYQLDSYDKNYGFSLRLLRRDEGILTAPTNVTGTNGTYPNKTVITWTAVSGAESYIVAWNNNVICDVTGTSYEDINSPCEQTEYRVWAVDETTGQSSGFGSDYDAYRGSPGAPTNVSATDGTYADKVVVTWNSVSYATSGYVIYRGSTQIGTTSELSFNDTDSPPCTATTYYVYSLNDCGQSTSAGSNTGYRSKPATPGTISGDLSISPGEENTTKTYSISSVTGATSYTWDKSMSAYPVNPPYYNWSAGTLSASLKYYDNTTGGGTISVSASNTCGTSTAKYANVLINTN